MTWWRRAFASLRPKPPRLDDRVRFSLDAADVLSRADNLVFGLLDSPELAPFVRAAGVDVSKAVEMTAPLDRVRFVAQASVLGAGRVEARCGDLLYAVLRLDPAAAEALAKAGVTRARLTTFLAHGVVAHPPITDGPRGEELEVMLHNDDYTPQDFVVSALVDVAGLSAQEAAARMLEVHEHGGSVVATLPRAKAIEVANTILSRARDAGFPLLATVESFATSD